MSRDDEIWLNEQIARDRARQGSDHGYTWLIIAVLVGWFLLALVLTAAYRLVEVLRG